MLIEGARTDAARRVWQRAPDWKVPTLWRSEFLNVLATSMRAGALSRDQALAAWRAAIRLFGRHEGEPEGESVLDTAQRLKISAYDAQFVVLAAQLGVPFVTSERRLRTACGAAAASPEEFAPA